MDSFPSEVWCAIFDFLGPGDRQHKAALVCKAWLAAARVGFTSLQWDLFSRSNRAPLSQVIPERVTRVCFYDYPSPGDAVDSNTPLAGMHAGVHCVRTLPATVSSVCFRVHDAPIAAGVALAHLPPQVRELEICYTGSASGRPLDITGCIALSGLTRLRLSGTVTWFQPPGAKVMKVKLRELDISKMSAPQGRNLLLAVSPDSLEEIRNTGSVPRAPKPSLTLLHMERAPASCVPMPHLVSLQALSVGNCGNTDWMRALHDLTRLTRMCLPINAIDQRGTELLLEHTNLRELELSEKQAVMGPSLRDLQLFWRSMGEHLMELELLSVPRVPSQSGDFLHKDLPPQLRLLRLTTPPLLPRIDDRAAAALVKARPKLWLQMAKRMAMPVEDAMKEIAMARKRKASGAAAGTEEDE
jgi:hypothetical protein